MNVVPIYAGLPQTTDAARGLALLQSGTARQVMEMKLSPEDMALAIAAAKEIVRSLIPARPEQIALEIEALALHYPTINRTYEESLIINGHWLEDLSGWPLDMIQDACRNWRNSPERYFPTPGQLKALSQASLDGRRSLAERARELLALADKTA